MSPVGVLLILGVIVAMVTLGWATLQPTRVSVWAAVIGLAMLPTLFVGPALWVWALGR